MWQELFLRRFSKCLINWETYSEPCQTSKMELLTIFCKKLDLRFLTTFSIRLWILLKRTLPSAKSGIFRKFWKNYSKLKILEQVESYIFIHLFLCFNVYLFRCSIIKSKTRLIHFWYVLWKENCLHIVNECIKED